MCQRNAIAEIGLILRRPWSNKRHLDFISSETLLMAPGMNRAATAGFRRAEYANRACIGSANPQRTQINFDTTYRRLGWR